MNILPGSTSPQPEEMFSSWFARLAYNHGISSQQLYKYLIPKHKFPYSAIYKSEQSINDLLTLLASSTLTSYERIKQTLLTNSPLYKQSRVFHKEKTWLLYSTPRSDYSNKSGLMYCPGCLTSDGNHPYFRQRWSLSFLTVCLDCSLMLLDRCPRCASPPAFLHIPIGRCQDTLRISTCWQCGFDLANALTANASCEYLTNQQQLLHQLSLVELTDQYSAPTYFFVLHYALQTLLSLLRNNKIALPSKVILHQRQWLKPWGFTQLPIPARAELLHWAYRLLVNGHNHYQVHLTTYYKTKPYGKYPTYLLNTYLRELLNDRSAEELIPLFGLASFDDFSQSVD